MNRNSLSAADALRYSRVQAIAFVVFIAISFLYGAYYYIVGLEYGQLQGSHAGSIIKEFALVVALMLMAWCSPSLMNLLRSNAFLIAAMIWLLAFAVAKGVLSGGGGFTLSLKTSVLMFAFFILAGDVNCKFLTLRKVLIVVFLVQIPFALVDVRTLGWDGETYGTLTNPSVFAFFSSFVLFLLVSETNNLRYLALLVPSFVYSSDSFTGQVVVWSQIFFCLLISIKLSTLRFNVALLVVGGIIATVIFPESAGKLVVFSQDVIGGLLFSGAVENNLGTISISNRVDQVEMISTLADWKILFWGVREFHALDSSIISLLWNFGLVAFMPLLSLWVLWLVKNARRMMVFLMGNPLYGVALLPVIVFPLVTRIHIFHSFWVCTILLLYMMNRELDMNLEPTRSESEPV